LKSLTDWPVNVAPGSIPTPLDLIILSQERVIDNSVDEANWGLCQPHYRVVLYEDKSLSVTDEWQTRYMPGLDNFTEEKISGEPSTKYTAGEANFSNKNISFRGLHGVGISVVNALFKTGRSKYFVVIGNV